MSILNLFVPNAPFLYLLKTWVDQNGLNQKHLNVKKHLGLEKQLTIYLIFQIFRMKYLVGPYYAGPFKAGPYWRYFSNVQSQTLIDKHKTLAPLTPYHEK